MVQFVEYAPPRGDPIRFGPTCVRLDQRLRSDRLQHLPVAARLAVRAHIPDTSARSQIGSRVVFLRRHVRRAARSSPRPAWPSLRAPPSSQVFGILGSNAAFDCPKSGRQPVTPTRRTNPTTDLWSVMGRKFARPRQAPQCFPPHPLVDFDLNGKPIANRGVLQAASPAPV